jgi:hypothetical protein
VVSFILQLVLLTITYAWRTWEVQTCFLTIYKKHEYTKSSDYGSSCLYRRTVKVPAARSLGAPAPYPCCQQLPPTEIRPQTNTAGGSEAMMCRTTTKCIVLKFHPFTWTFILSQPALPISISLYFLSWDTYLYFRFHRSSGAVSPSSFITCSSRRASGYCTKIQFSFSM